MPDVFVPACLTPGTTGLMVVHNHPSGDPTPSPDDARLTLRLCAAADVLDLPLLDHLIVGDEHRYFSFREAGLMGASPIRPVTNNVPPLRPADSVEVLGRVKASLAALAAGAALTRTSALHTEGIYRSGGESRRRENTMSRTVAHTQHHRDDRPPHADLLRVRHDSTNRARLAGDGHAARGDVRGRRRLSRPNRSRFDSTRGRTPARLVLVDAMELAWQRASTAAISTCCCPADPGLVGLNTLQHWLWQRLQAPAASQVAA